MRFKNRVFFLALVLSLVVGLVVPAQPARAAVSVTFFYDSLAPYGDWVTVSSYGRCWRPGRVAAGWQPYLDGEWVYTDAGWTWLSSDPWGGDPYHYGTWVFTARYGWIWIPGTIWAPAWVTWYITDDAFGWAPVPPSFAVGISGYSGRAVTVSRSAYVFVPAAQFAGVNVSSVRVPVAQNATFIARSRPLTRFAVQGGVLSSGGPALPQVERVVGRRIERVSIAQAKTQPIPIRTSLHGSRGSIVVPAGERARLIMAHEKHAPPQGSRTKPEVATSDRVVQPPPPARHEKREKATAHQPPPPPPAASIEKRERVPVHQPPPSNERHEKTGTQAQVKSGQPPPPAHVEKQPNVQPKPQGPPPAAHPNPPGKEKEKAHGKEN